MKILLLEDDYQVSDSMMRAFEVRGHITVRVRTVKDARDILGSMPFDLAILDLNVPDGKGTELLPLDFEACVYTGLPSDVGDCGVPVFSKGDPFSLIDHVDSLAKQNRHTELGS